MNRFFLFCFFSFWARPGRGQELRSHENGGRVRVEIVIDRNPPWPSGQPHRIEIIDKAGENVSDAQVIVNYYMPPMPRMAP